MIFPSWAALETVEVEDGAVVVVVVLVVPCTESES